MSTIEQRIIKVKNALGIHARPASAIAKLLQNYKSEVFIEYDNQKIDARSIINILMLGIKRDTEIKLIAQGIDAEQVIQHLIELFDTQFGEKR